MKVYDTNGKLLTLITPGALSRLVIDTHKNWEAYRLENLGAPTADTHAPRARASDILSGRFGMARMPDMALNKIMVGQGAGNSPIEDDKPTGVPSGLIAMWHGLIANIPSGWVICDGNNSTPNLLAKFVEGVATAATNPGTTGGAKSKTTAGHSHTQGATGAPSGQLVSASGSGYTSPEPGHTHTNPGTNSNTDSISDIRPPYYDVAFIMKT